MNGIGIGPAANDFIWAGGIEDTFIPQTRPGYRALDEYELMGHYEHWREDLALARDVNLQALRWGVPWYRVEPEPGHFDWSWTDQVIPYMVETLGITPIIDLMHYGCPLWLRDEFANPGYPQAVADYAAAFAKRYRHLVRWYTPLNEPLVNAWMCGQRGLWPPYLRGETGYLRVMLQLAAGIVRTVAALKEVDPTAIMVHVEATGVSRAAVPGLAIVAAEDTLRNYLCYDLITGRVTPDHPLYLWLLRHGVSVVELHDLIQRAIPLDVLGINFYPQWSTREAYLDAHGRLAYRIVEREGQGFGEMLEAYYQRYRAPIIITETSARPPRLARHRWLENSLGMIKAARERGIPIHGYTWFPLFTMIDWRYRTGRQPVDRYRLELGLFKLQARDAQGRRWQATHLVERFKQLRAAPEATIGSLAMLEPKTLEGLPAQAQ